MVLSCMIRLMMTRNISVCSLKSVIYLTVLAVNKLGCHDSDCTALVSVEI